ncbi:MAG TPA: VOC family protein [Candidatus Sulfotelmatobacter sp.]|nr:VOC family protein [Candidatus Sulfotelmatobacter sp.]
MQRVTGIGGVFFKSKDPKRLAEWYRTHLGMNVEEWGGVVFRWASPENPSGVGTTIWSPFEENTAYFSPSQASFMINYRVADLDALLALLRSEGCEVEDQVQKSEYGKFGWVMDPEGNRIELWQPPEGR